MNERSSLVNVPMLSTVGKAYIALMLVGTLVLLTNLSGYRPLTAHEVLVAQTAREMLQSGDVILPRYFREPRLQKPPLAYWQTVLSFSMLGQSEWSARLPAVISGMGLVLGTTFVVGRWHNKRTGFLAGFITLTSVYFLVQARLAEIDITLALLVAACLSAYFELARMRDDKSMSSSAKQIFLVIGFWISTALVALAKGPVGLGMILVTIVCESVISWKCRGVRALLSVIGPMIFLVTTLTWPIAVAVREPSAVNVWIRETWQRAIRDPNDVVRSPFFYLGAVLVLTLPWTPFWLLRCFRLGRRVFHGRPLPSLDLFLCCWLFGSMAMLSCFAGKQEHYLVPALPACCVWSARECLCCFRWLSHPARFGAVRSQILVITATALLLAVIVSVEIWALPPIYGKRVEADWFVTASPAIDKDLTVIALGHSVQWLVFYADFPMTRCDSLEEFWHAHAKKPCIVLTTAPTAQSIRERCQVSQELASPQTPTAAKYSVHLLWINAIPKREPRSR